MPSKFDTAFALIPTICFITDGETIEETNNAFLSFFECDSTESFLVKYRCICNLLEPREGFLQKKMGMLSWIEYVVQHPEHLHKALIKSTVFSIIANAYHNDGGTSFVVLMQKLDEKSLSQAKLLEQYKHVVDRSAIVSKTDERGIITYVNDRFCDISGYRKEELLGKPHNIIRHPDMPAETFAQMWQTILAKKPWYGIVKNRKKDGSSYYVDTVINPIVDCDGEIIEFIGIRYDVTYLETIKNNLYDELEETQKELIYRLGEISESRSLETGNHVKRVAEYSKLLAIKAGLSEHDASLLHLASPMHDIGKVGIPDSVLHKKGELTDVEWEIMRTHSEKGFTLLRNSKRPILQAAAIVAYEHHERWDGTGYPRGLRGKEIHIYGRITAIADVFDALGSDRSYKKAWEDQKIFDYFKAERGRKFDPLLIDAFFKNLNQFLQIRDAYRENA
ncbi:MAG: PAS domain S-box protein [Campylobacterales bacterium]|jgi:PAS domain S-box-containing protein